MRTKEDMIRDQRTIEAMRKQFMGANGKIGCVGRMMGEPIIRQGGGFFEQTFADLDGTALIDENEIPTMDEDETATREGHFFCGLSRGYQLEVKYIDDRSELSVRWRGYVVYYEVGGQLNGYVPGEWEEVIEKLYVEAKHREGKQHQDLEERSAEVGQRRKEMFLEEMKRKWGF